MPMAGLALAPGLRLSSAKVGPIQAYVCTLCLWHSAFFHSYWTVACTFQIYCSVKMAKRGDYGRTLMATLHMSMGSHPLATTAQKRHQTSPRQNCTMHPRWTNTQRTRKSSGTNTSSSHTISSSLWVLDFVSTKYGNVFSGPNFAFWPEIGNIADKRLQLLSSKQRQNTIDFVFMREKICTDNSRVKHFVVLNSLQKYFCIW